ncbi:MAG: hypothetical protein IJX87_03495 [Clostridia bacterium]|nr:hypothetical protein [Clostridia bacterium]
MRIINFKAREMRKTQIFWAWSSFLAGEVLQFWSYVKTGRILLIEDLYGGWWIGMILSALLGFFAVPSMLGLTKMFEEDDPVLSRVLFYIFNFGIFFAPYATIFLTLLLFFGFIMYLDENELKNDTNKKGMFYIGELVAIVLGNIFMHWYYARTKCDPIVTPFLNALGVHERLTGWLWISTACLLVNFVFFAVLTTGTDEFEKGETWYFVITILVTMLFPGIGQVLLLIANIVVACLKNRFADKAFMFPMIGVCLVMLVMWIIGMVHLVQTQGWQELPLVEYVLEFLQAVK